MADTISQHSGYLNQSFTLPCGAVLSNRLVKAAMTERISNWKLEPTEKHQRLYENWSASGAGLLITGNVMFDRRHLESAGNVWFDEAILQQLARWAAAGKRNGNQVWIQISHAGRQTNRFTNLRPSAPSEVQLKKLALFGRPKAMTEEDIQEVIKGFVRTANIAKKAGFDGVQIHSAHGYLLSQFLSPLTNLRTDQWGGDIQNRSRLLQSIIREVRTAVGPQFPISVKLNSSDFQKGGLSEEESLEVVKLLETEKVDLLEISGGTYENVAFFLKNEEQGNMEESTRKREAYFMDFAKKIRSVSDIPLMITGGFRSYDYCNKALQNNELDLIGMARPFLTNLDEIPDFLKGEVPHLRNKIVRTGIKAFEDAAEGGYYARQVIQISKGRKPRMKMSALWSSVFLIVHEFKKTMYRKWRALF